MCSRKGVNYSAAPVLSRWPKSTSNVLDDYDDFVTYVTSYAVPGDEFIEWDFEDLCRGDNSLILAKYPDAKGRTPRTGAY
jgi:hypothetical protein